MKHALAQVAVVVLGCVLFFFAWTHIGYIAFAVIVLGLLGSILISRTPEE